MGGKRKDVVQVSVVDRRVFLTRVVGLGSLITLQGCLSSGGAGGGGSAGATGATTSAGTTNAASPSTGSSGSTGATGSPTVTPSTPSTGLATGNPSFRLVSAVGGVVPFSLGMGFARGDFPATASVAVSSAQVVVKRRWSDGSIKHAIISGRASLTRGTPVNVAVTPVGSVASAGRALTSGDIVAAAPSASVDLAGIGRVDLAPLLSAPVRTWVSGSEMVECHYRAAVPGGAQLGVWFHVRLFADGRMWVRAVVENGQLDNGSGGLAARTDRSYVPTVTIGGNNVYTNGGAALAHVRNTRWTAEGWIGGDPQVTYTHDVAYLIRTKLVPNYWKRNPSTATLNGLAQTYVPMGIGNFTPDMGNTGFQSQIGLLPQWDALYCTSGSDAALRSVLTHSSSLNSYPVIYRASDGSVPTPDAFPTWTLDGPGQGGIGSVGAGGRTWEVAHHPSAGYLAYMLTGDYWHYETMQFQSAVNYLFVSSGGGSGTSRIVTGQTRGIAWTLRTISQLCSLAPDGDVIAASYARFLGSNIAYWRSVMNRPGLSPLGYLYEYGGTGGTPYGDGRVAAWQHHFWIQVLGYGSDLEPLADMIVWREVRDWMYRAVVGVLGDGSGFCFTGASNYTIKISATDTVDPTAWYRSWAEVYAATFGGSGSCGAVLQGTSGGAPDAASGGYWGNLLPAIAYAVEHGAAGASQAWTRLTSASNWSTVENSGFDNVPIWGIIPR